MLQDTIKISNSKEQNAEGTKGSSEEIESNVNVIIPFISQLGDEHRYEISVTRY